MSFRSMAGLMDASFSGSKYTWCNNRQGHPCIWKRLDRLLHDQSAVEVGISFAVRHWSRAPPVLALFLFSCFSRLDTSLNPFRYLNC